MKSVQSRLDKKIDEVLLLAGQVLGGYEYVADRLQNAGIPTPELKKHFQDSAVDLFRSRCMDFTRAPAMIGSGDMVQLSSLRRGFGIGILEEPPGWAEAIGFYFASPLTKYSLADLCTRYAIFRNSPVDRYGRPTNHIGSANGQQSSRSDRNTANANRLRDDINSASSQCDERGDRLRDAKGVPSKASDFEA